LGLQSEAQALFIQSADGFYASVPMDNMKVEIQVDDGDWQEAALRTPSPGLLLWVQERYHWPVASGPHTITVRATDGNGDIQTVERRGTLPNGATGYHSVEVRV
jgi:hypothetical protein